MATKHQRYETKQVELGMAIYKRRIPANLIELMDKHLVELKSKAKLAIKR